MTHRPLVAVALAASILAPLGVAQAASAPRYDTWNGKTTHDHLAIGFNGTSTSRAVYVQVTVACTSPAGAKTTFGLSATAKVSRSGVFSVTKAKAYNDTSGTLKVRAKVRTGKTATGTVAWTLPASFGSCGSKDTFKLKYAVGHAG